MPQPPYSPDLAPCDFFLFPKLKRPMKGRRYATPDEIKTASKEELKNILKNDFLKCFEDWKNRWHKCIISHGDYFEGNKIDEALSEGTSGFHLELKAALSLDRPLLFGEFMSGTCSMTVSRNLLRIILFSGAIQEGNVEGKPGKTRIIHGKFPRPYDVI
ncbi:hypothetical protein LAZ67_15002049 [Cordylochernes scorpioides]|uniref:Transposase n=1 Tax=Cordylochernes scorpioides TaxID=51811 RepID=A0ABY6LBC6_9ARAC|nr:hypothetical protein LAZ67_15002049 [Cordylochernes scorpioides]